MHDAAGRRAWVKDALENLTTYTYDENGNQLTFTDANGNTTTYIYDDLNRRVATQYPSQNGATVATSTIYDDLGRRIAEIDANGVTTGFNYDGAGRLVAVTNNYVPGAANPIVTYYGYDLAGNKTSQTDANNHTTQFSYDLLGRQQSRTLPLGQSESVVYNNIGQVWKTIDFKGQITQLAYDPAGRVRTKFFFANQAGTPGEARCYRYDPLGRLSQITERRGANLDMTSCDGYTAMLGLPGGDGKGTPALASLRIAVRAHIPRSTFHAVCSFVRSSSVLAGATAMGLCGLVLRLIPLPVRRMLVAFYLRGGWRIRSDRSQGPAFSRRALRLPCYWLRAVSFILVFVVVMEQLGIDRMQSAWADCVYNVNPTVDDSTRITQFSYDADGHLTQINSPEGVVNYGYDPITGRHSTTCTAISQTPGANSQIDYGYDELGRLKTVTQVVRNGAAYREQGMYPNEVTTYHYDAVGNRASVQMPNGVVTAYTYNGLNRLTSLTHKDASGNLLASYAYVLHPTGRRVSATEQLLQPDNTMATINVSWSYNNLYRLTGETSTSPTLGSAQHTSAYTYDNVGNRTQKTETAGSSTDVITYNYDHNDQLQTESSSVNSGTAAVTSYTYDANGSETGKSGPDGTYAFTYNLQNKLSTATITGTGGSTTTSYLYNEQGIRVRTISNGTVNNYLIDQNNPSGYAQVIEELPSRGAIPTVSYTIGDDVLGQCAGSSGATPSFLLADGHGSTRQLVTAGTSGLDIVRQYNYDAYGKSLSELSNIPTTDILYCGEQFDSALSQYNLRARYYDPANGRLTQQDPYTGDVFEPASLHKYLYCHDDPTNRKDPSGHMGLLQTQLSLATCLILAAILLPVLTEAFLYARSHITGRRLSAEEAKQLQAARDVLRLMSPTNSTQDIYKSALNANIVAHRKLVDRYGKPCWGKTHPYGNLGGAAPENESNYAAGSIGTKALALWPSGPRA